MLLWVDYTNWRDEREWRCIVPRGEPYVAIYPTQAAFAAWDGQSEPSKEGGVKTWVWDVSMVDRGYAKRTLRLDHIHGFFVGEHPERNRPIDGELRGERNPLEDEPPLDDYKPEEMTADLSCHK